MYMARPPFARAQASYQNVASAFNHVVVQASVTYGF